MPWLTKRVPVEHQCVLPGIGLRRTGRMWQCGDNECRRVWVIDRDPYGKIWCPYGPEHRGDH
jgi:hypothetical protein